MHGMGLSSVHACVSRMKLDARDLVTVAVPATGSYVTVVTFSDSNASSSKSQMTTMALRGERPRTLVYIKRDVFRCIFEQG